MLQLQALEDMRVLEFCKSGGQQPDLALANQNLCRGASMCMDRPGLYHAAVDPKNKGHPGEAARMRLPCRGHQLDHCSYAASSVQKAHNIMPWRYLWTHFAQSRSSCFAKGDLPQDHKMSALHVT